MEISPENYENNMHSSDDTTTNQQGIYLPRDGSRHQERHTVLGNLTIDYKVLSQDTRNGLFILENISIGKGGPPRHLHYAQEEWFYAVEGEYIVEVGDTRYELRPGDSVLAPRQIPHAWAHVDEGVGRLLVTFQPAGAMEAFFDAFANMTAAATKDEIQRLFRAHGMEVVGPPL